LFWGGKAFTKLQGVIVRLLMARVEQEEPTADFGAIDHRWGLAVLSNRTGIELALKTK
jgi:hypothetical protein